MTEERSPADVIATLERTLDQLPRLAVGLRQAGAGGGEGWSAAQVLDHMAEFEVVAGARLRAVLTEDSPPLATFGQEAFAARFAEAVPATAALELFAVNRRANLRLLRACTEADWGRTGVHPRRGPEPLSKTAAMIAAHDEGHLRQLREALGER